MTTRNRSRTLYATPLVHQKVVTAAGSTVFNSGSPHSLSMSETMIDELTPSYFANAKRGKFLQVNPMSHSKTTFVADSGAVEMLTKYNGVDVWTMTWSGNLAFEAHRYVFGATMTPPYYGFNPSYPSSGPLVTEALANARSRGWDVLTWLAEFGKTMELIRNFRTRVLKRAESVAKGIERQNDLRVANDLFASNWLEARYGWRQIAFDLEAITEAIYKLNRTKPPFIRGYAQDENVGTPYTGTYPASSYMRYVTPSTLAYDYGRCRLDINQTRTRRTRAGVILEALIDDLVEINPFVTAWEVIPFSFIVDWFVNIGDVIAAYSPSVTENLLGAWSSQEQITETTCVLTPATVGNPTSGFYYSPSSTTPYTCVTTNITKTRVSESPSASLALRFNLDDVKIVDLASIFLVSIGRIVGGLLKSNRI